MIRNVDDIKSVFAEFDAQGIHRTGTEGDIASAHWLVGRIEELGVEAELQPLPFTRRIPVATSFEVEGERIEAVPMYDAGETDAAGVSGRLSGLDGTGNIGVVVQSPETATAFLEAREAASFDALVIATNPNVPGIAPINAERFGNPFLVPVLQVAGTEWPRLEHAASRGVEGRVMAETAWEEVTVFNTTARISGRDPSLAPLVVMTPRSGWWECASERGGGFVLFLEIMRDLAARQPDRDVIFTANTGHELSHVGLDYFLEQNPGLIGSAHCWIHLGANFAASIGGSVLLQSSDEEVRAIAREQMVAHGVTPDRERVIGERPAGEARNVFDGGGRYISLLGGNGLFHSPEDRWPGAVDIDRTVRLAESFVGIGRSLASA